MFCRAPFAAAGREPAVSSPRDTVAVCLALIRDVPDVPKFYRLAAALSAAKCSAAAH
jgi:hypothetical protein